MAVALDKYRFALRSAEYVSRLGEVLACHGLVIEANGPDAFLGELCHIYTASHAAPVAAEVVGFRNDAVLLMPYGQVRGIRPGAEVLATGKPPRVPAGEELLGRIVDAFIEPLDGASLTPSNKDVPLYAETANPVQRARIERVFETGVKAIDTLQTVGEGQRMGLFAGSGVGKSQLLGMIARHCEADVNVIALIGERGREVRDFVEECLGSEGLAKSVVIVATSDQPALIRTHAAFAATSIAEYFRSAGKRVVLLMDSITRFAMAQREVGLSIGEPPTARGYTPSVFTMLPQILERAGMGQVHDGSITAFYTVLVEGDDMNEPVADHVRAILDGHIVLGRELVQKGHYPPIDVLRSVSRLARQLSSEDEIRAADDAIAMLSLYERSRDMIDFGAYEEGANPKLDRAVALAPLLQGFLRQPVSEKVARPAACEALASVLDRGEL